MDRRRFVSTSALSAASVLGANDRVRGAIIGSGGRGRLLTSEFKEIGVEMAAVCDVYKPNLEAGLKIASTGAKAHADYKRVLDDKSIDVVIVATPDHWHARMVIDAVQAGKDVYVEKPMAHTPDEGYQIIDAVRRTNRIVQVGTQRRSFPLFQEAKQVRDTAGMGDAGEWLVVQPPGGGLAEEGV
jgi:predicted dehydrogenase